MLARELHISPASIEACIGPGVGSCCYLVDEPVLSAVRQLPIDWQSAVSASLTPGQSYLDLPQVNKLLLLAAGLRPENIHLSGVCTHDDAEHFFSHRRDRGNTGRLIATIGLIPPGKAGFAGTGREVRLQQSGNGDETSG
jgi:copper oxidase (laccase) domain-containing protein